MKPFYFSDIESEEKLSLEKPTPSGLVFTAIRIVQQASKEKFNFAAASEIYEDFKIITELPLEDDLKVGFRGNVTVTEIATYLIFLENDIRRFGTCNEWK